MSALLLTLLLAGPSENVGDISPPNTGSYVTSSRHYPDDTAVQFGNTSAAPDAKLLWDTSGTHQLRIWLTDCDGGGTDCVPLYWATGTDDAIMNGNLTIGGATTGFLLKPVGTNGDFIIGNLAGTQAVKFITSVDGILSLADESGGGLTFAAATLQTVTLQSYGQANPITIATQSGSSASAGAAVTVTTGDRTNAGNVASGALNLGTGATTTDGNSGPVNIYSGVAGAGIADAGDLVLAVNGAPGTGTTVATFDASAGGDLTIAGTIKTEVATGEVPAEPHACDAAHAGVIVTVDDTNDTAFNQPCVCLNLDGSGYDWRQLNDVTGTACPYF